MTNGKEPITDASELIARLDVLLMHWGLNKRSPLLRSILAKHGLPADFNYLDEVGFELLIDALEERWLALPPDQKVLRFKLNDQLKKLRLSWDAPPILEWLKLQQTAFTQLSTEQLTDLHNRLEQFSAKPVAASRVPAAPALD